MIKSLISVRRLAILCTIFILPQAARAQQPSSAGDEEQVVVRVKNPLAMMRKEEIVSLKWSEMQERLPALSAGSVRVRDVTSGQEVTTQLVDDDADGQTDALLFLASLWPKATHDYVLEAAPSDLQPTPLVHVRHDEERDDVAWESNRIAFRIYGQGLWSASAYDPLHSNGIDVWLKSVHDLVLNRWYSKGHDAYHRDTGEGADFFSVGPSLGAGGTAIWEDGTMHRAENFASYRILADGPLRAIFELNYDPWQAGDREVSEVKRITIDAGQNLFKSQSTFESTLSDSLTYVVGFVKREEGVVGSLSRAQPWAWLSTWGPVERKNGGHGELGTAALIDGDRLNEVREAENHYLAFAKAKPGETLTHYIGAGWTASGDFQNVEDWWGYLENFARGLQVPLQVTVQPSKRGVREKD